MQQVIFPGSRSQSLQTTAALQQHRSPIVVKLRLRSRSATRFLRLFLQALLLRLAGDFSQARERLLGTIFLLLLRRRKAFSSSRSLLPCKSAIFWYVLVFYSFFLLSCNISDICDAIKKSHKTNTKTSICMANMCFSIEEVKTFEVLVARVGLFQS